HGEYRRRAIFPHDFGHHEQVAPARIRSEVAPQLAAIGGLANKVELVVQIDIELGNDLARLQATRIGSQALDQSSQRAHKREVFLDGLAHAWTQYLDGHFAAIMQYGKVHLRDG